MSQIALTGEERVAALRSFGYSLREAQFLCLVALHGGHFLQRQYCQFLGKEVGGTTAALIQKLVAHRHVTVLTGCRNAKVYHLSGRPLYEALGQEDNRNRRSRAAEAIRNRLLALDFVLDHPDRLYLATEQEKVDYFVLACGLTAPVLPNKHYRSPASSIDTVRYFVDKCPLFLEAKKVTFTFVDAGSATRAGFETYLDQYRDLFAALGDFGLVYVSTSERPASAAQRVFGRFLERLGGIEMNGPADRLLKHFEDRLRYESGQLALLDRSKLVRLRNEMQEFSTAEHNALYQRFKAGARPAVAHELKPAAQAIPPLQAHFSTYVSPHSYSVFGTLERSKCDTNSSGGGEN